jgi:hypothetical protein
MVSPLTKLSMLVLSEAVRAVSGARALAAAAAKTF